MNGYPPSLANKIRDWDNRFAHAVHTEVEGDYIVSFSGCVFILGPTDCQALFHAYFDFAESANSRQ